MRLAWLTAPVVQALNTVVCQTQADALVFEGLGKTVDAVCGNLKFDVALQPELSNMGRAWKLALQAEPVLLFASSREGEEEVLLDAMVKAQFFKRQPNACVLIVPRHPQRFDEVFELMVRAAGKLGVARPVRRSAWHSTQAVANGLPSKVVDNRMGQVRLVLGDSMGEMPAYYSAADLALLGGSWLPFGGQNLIEACAYGCPVWFGPHPFNFSKAAKDAVQAGAARPFDSLAVACEAFLSQSFDSDPDKKAAFAYARSHRGATLQTFEVLRQGQQ
jgi:3-deoxy-D-manno-octulosonic-acid transferase